MVDADNPPFALSPGAVRVHFTRHALYIEVTVTGFKNPEGVARAIKDVGVQARAAQVPGVLIDVTQLVGQMNGDDHARVGHMLAEELRGLRCAVVARADRKRGEIAPSAHERGLNYAAFDDLAGARRWLLGREVHAHAPAGVHGAAG